MNRPFRIISPLSVIGSQMHSGIQVLGSFSSEKAAHQAACLLRNPHWTPTNQFVMTSDDFNTCLSISRFEGQGFFVDWNGDTHDLENLGEFHYSVMVDAKNGRIEILDGNGLEIHTSDYHATHDDLKAALAG